MKEFIKTRRFKILMFIMALLIGLTVGAAKTGLLGAFTNQIVNTILSPIENTSNYITGKATRFLERFVEAGVYLEENKQLKEEVRTLKSDLIEYEKIKKENEQLRVAAGLRNRFVDQVFQPAMIVERDPLDKFYSFKINRGSVDEISVNDPVRTADGLVGIVTEVTGLEANVITIFNPNLEVSVRSVNSQDSGVLKGDLLLAEKGRCYMTMIPNESLMEPGDMIITAGSGVYPADINIGKVLSVEKAVSGLTKTAIVELSVDIKAIKEVLVITDFEGQITDIDLGGNPALPEPSIEESSEEESSVPEESSTPPPEPTPPTPEPTPEPSQEEEDNTQSEEDDDAWDRSKSWEEMFGGDD